MVIPSLVLIVLVGAVIAIEARRPADWRVELDEYLQVRNARWPGGATTASSARASKPWNFSRDMSHAVINDRAWRGIDLPFPPEEVWCVLLKRDRFLTYEPGGETAYQVVFVSYHTDRLWNQGWVIHEGAENPLAPAFIDALSTIGCDLGLEKMRLSDIQPMVMIGGG